jgi:hypothetical protein
VSTGLARPSFKSSLTYQGSNGSVGGDTIDVINYAFSTATFSLDSFSSFIESTTSIYFDIHHVFYFPLAPGAGQFGILSTSLYCLEHPVPDAHLEDAVSYTFNTYCNVYFRSMTFKIPTDFAQQAYTSSYQMCHYLPGGLNDPIYNPINGYNIPYLYVGTSVANSMFVTILN